jgi:hypothetical protein
MFWFLATKLPILEWTYKNSETSRVFIMCLCISGLLALANESHAHSTDSCRFSVSFMNARIAKIFFQSVASRCCQPSTDWKHPFHVCLNNGFKAAILFAHLYCSFYRKTLDTVPQKTPRAAHEVNHQVTVQITASFTELIPAEPEALAKYNVTVIKAYN